MYHYITVMYYKTNNELEKCIKFILIKLFELLAYYAIPFHKHNLKHMQALHWTKKKELVD